jgi:hypothetical protein
MAALVLVAAALPEELLSFLQPKNMVEIVNKKRSVRMGNKLIYSVLR